jgi:hypothetical protein
MVGEGIIKVRIKVIRKERSSPEASPPTPEHDR